MINIQTLSSCFVRSALLFFLCYGMGFAQNQIVRTPKTQTEAAQPKTPKDTSHTKHSNKNSLTKNAKPISSEADGASVSEDQPSSRVTISGNTYTIDSVSFTMIPVEGGTFNMGSASEQRVPIDEKPQHPVTLSSYFIGETEVTQALWQTVMGNNPSFFQGSNRPVEQVSWNDCQLFIQKLKELTHLNFRLPTEAEWEFAARGGNKSHGYEYSGCEYYKFWDYYRAMLHTQDAKKSPPNELGIYDMSGNVWEWCQDWYALYSPEAITNPSGAASGVYRVMRGGSVDDIFTCCRNTARDCGQEDSRCPTFGLRLAISTSEGITFTPSANIQTNTANSNIQFVQTGNTYRIGSATFNMIQVAGGTFNMGATPEQEKPHRSEKPVHAVTLSTYFIGETEVTEGLWTAVMGSPTQTTESLQEPARGINWYQCQRFLRKLNSLTGKRFRLPTEAEWEFAARGGNLSHNYQYAGSNRLQEVAWYHKNIGKKAFVRATKTKAPNELGIYDMCGNVQEWCQDWYGDYDAKAVTNPQGPESGSERVVRGGDSYSNPWFCRTTVRLHPQEPTRGDLLHTGFRLAL
jgi:formylglycine-generating enzyme required for sulfatase activity